MAHASELTAPSVVQAKDEATISSVVASTVEATLFNDHSRFARGEKLIVLDCAIQKADLEVARAESLAAATKHNSLKLLQSKGGVGRSEVAVAEAVAAAAAAAVRRVEIILEGCEVVAPFDGWIVEYKVNAFEYVEPSQPLVEIVSAGSPEVEIIAPAEWLQWMVPGKSGRMRLDAIDVEYDVAVTGIGPVVDPVSRTIKLTAVFKYQARGILPGMAGLVSFEAEE